MRRFTDKNCWAVAGRDEQTVEVAKGVHHAGDAQTGEQENQRVTQRQGVIDGAEQHDDQGERKEQPAPGRDNENAPLTEAQGRRAIALPAE